MNNSKKMLKKKKRVLFLKGWSRKRLIQEKLDPGKLRPRMVR